MGDNDCGQFFVQHLWHVGSLFGVKMRPGVGLKALDNVFGALGALCVGKWSFLAQEELLLSSIEELIIAMGNKG